MSLVCKISDDRMGTQDQASHGETAWNVAQAGTCSWERVWLGSGLGG